MSDPFDMPIMSKMRRLGVITIDATPEIRRNAQREHGQTLERLRERGGLCWTELYCIMFNKRGSQVLHNTENQEKVRVYLLDEFKLPWVAK